MGDLSSIDIHANLLAAKNFLANLDEWRFQPNVTLFSAWPWPVGAAAAYVVVILSLQRFMTTRKPLDIPYTLFLHNITLSFASFLLGSWLTYILVSEFIGGMTPHQLICSRSIYEIGQIQMIYYLNMFYKVWEFLDTIFLVVRKKQVAFLHSYHHAATLILTWNQLMEHSAPQWVPIVINLWVHVVMYYYYAMSALKIKIWWKKYLTTLQICQFIVDVSLLAYAYASFIRSGFDTNVCYGTSTGAIVGIGVILSYLVLFIRFYVQTYSKRRTAEKSKDQ